MPWTISNVGGPIIVPKRSTPNQISSSKSSQTKSIWPSRSKTLVSQKTDLVNNLGITTKFGPKKFMKFKSADGEGSVRRFWFFTWFVRSPISTKMNNLFCKSVTGGSLSVQERKHRHGPRGNRTKNENQFLNENGAIRILRGTSKHPNLLAS